MTEQKKTRSGGATFHGFVPDDDPRYQSGWNYLSAKNLRPKPPEREREKVKSIEQRRIEDR